MCGVFCRLLISSMGSRDIEYSAENCPDRDYFKGLEAGLYGYIKIISISSQNQIWYDSLSIFFFNSESHYDVVPQY